MKSNTSAIAAAIVCACATHTLHAQTFNGGGLAIPDIGPANPYPSVINVSGVVGPIAAISVTITDFSHTFADDVGLLLVGPNGNALILADGPGDGAADDLTWTFTDAAASTLPMNGPLVSGVFRPGLNQYDDVFALPVPAPDAWFTSFAGAFGGGEANGAWNLYVQDFTAEDDGSIGSWSITFGVPGPGALAMMMSAMVVRSTRRRLHA